MCARVGVLTTYEATATADATDFGQMIAATIVVEFYAVAYVVQA